MFRPEPCLLLFLFAFLHATWTHTCANFIQVNVLFCQKLLLWKCRGVSHLRNCWVCRILLAELNYFKVKKEGSLFFSFFDSFLWAFQFKRLVSNICTSTLSIVIIFWLFELWNISYFFFIFCLTSTIAVLYNVNSSMI